VDADSGSSIRGPPTIQRSARAGRARGRPACPTERPSRQHGVMRSASCASCRAGARWRLCPCPLRAAAQLGLKSATVSPVRERRRRSSRMSTRHHGKRSASDFFHELLLLHAQRPTRARPHGQPDGPGSQSVFAQRFRVPRKDRRRVERAAQAAPARPPGPPEKGCFCDAEIVRDCRARVT